MPISRLHQLAKGNIVSVALFDVLFPNESARLRLAERRVRTLLEKVGIDDVNDPDMAEVIAELKAGREIRAASLYTKLYGAGMGESHVAIQELKQKLNL